MTVKLKLVVTEQAKNLLLATMRSYMHACNYVSNHVDTTHCLSRYKVQNDVYYQIRNIYGLKSQMACSVVRTTIAAYKTIRANTKEWIKPEFKIPFVDMVRNKDYSLDTNKRIASVNTLKGRIKIPFHCKGYERYFNDPDYVLGTAKLHTKHGKFYLLVSVTCDIAELDEYDVSNVVGIDRGVRFIATSYDSNGKTRFYSGKEVKGKRSKFKQLRRRLQRKSTPSSRRRLKRIGQRENRWMGDVNHCISKALVEENPSGTMFVLEDLTGVRAVTEKVWRRYRYETVSWSYYDLEQKLIYKALRNNQLVIKVDPAYTSQTCPKCGHTERANRRKSEHRFECKSCGYRSNDDRIGAMNLHRRGIEYLVPDAIPEEHDSSGQAAVNRPFDATRSVR